MFWDWSYTKEILPDLANASLVTLEATLLGFALALVLGLVLALLRMAHSRVLSTPTALLIEGIRSTPLLVQVFFIFFVLPDLGITLPPLTAGVFALGIHYATYCSEVYRAGIEGVPRGQWEAATALNMSGLATFRDVVLPQAIPPIVPVLGNYFIAIFKDTPILSAIAVLELMQTAKILGSENFRYTEPITLVGVFFLVFSLLASALVRGLELMLASPGRR
jgi:polar amino acid transport system permease protein